MRASYVMAIVWLVSGCGGGAADDGGRPGDVWSADHAVFVAPPRDAADRLDRESGDDLRADTPAPASDVVGSDGAPDVALDVAAADVPVVPDIAPDVAECDHGSVYGIVCDTEAQTLVAGAAVRVDAVDCNGEAVRRLTASDGGGYFTLTDVPVGLWMIHVERGDLSYEIEVHVEADVLTDITEDGLQACGEATGGNELCVKGEDTISVDSPLTTAQADIIWFIDTSGSMEAEANWLQQNINAFAQYIGSQQIDYHVVLIARGYDLCVPPPLGGPNCTDGPRFRHIREKVDSHDGLEKVIETYPQYQDFLRPDATTNFVAVSDDNSDKGAAWFRTEAGALTNPGFSDPYVFHSIVAMGPIPIIGCITGAFGGLVYLELTAETGGASFPICETNWAGIFGDLAETVVETVQSTCSFALPDPEAAANADLMSLAHLMDGQPALVPKVIDADGCGAQGGWYIDDTGEPDALVLCPATCRLLSGGVLHLAYDCLD